MTEEGCPPLGCEEAAAIGQVMSEERRVLGAEFQTALVLLQSRLLPPPSFSSHVMADGDESAKLWRVNRTIHELVKDRVSKFTTSVRMHGLIFPKWPGIPSCRR